MRKRDEARGRWIGAYLAGLAMVLVLLGGCSVGVQTYQEFRSAVDSGATCSQLWDIEKNFEGTPDEERVVSELDEIGCHTARSARADQDTE